MTDQCVILEKKNFFFKLQCIEDTMTKTNYVTSIT